MERLCNRCVQPREIGVRHNFHSVNFSIAQYRQLTIAQMFFKRCNQKCSFASFA